MRSFYSREQGAALSITVDKYVYVVLHHNVVLHHTSQGGIKTMFPHLTQDAKTLEEVRHAITRKCLEHYGVDGVDNFTTVASVSDIPSFGSGLGSSSAYTVGLLNCLSLSTDRQYTVYWRERLAELACKVEIERCGFPIGKQDAYGCAFGGLNEFRFNPDETVELNRLYVPETTLSSLRDSLVLIYTGRGRSSHDILRSQGEAVADAKKWRLLQDNRDRVFTATEFLKHGDVANFGGLLHEAWMAKKEVVRGISDEQIDSIYAIARRMGAWGGKVLGAGGGGFMLLSCPHDKQHHMLYEIQRVHPEVSHYPFRFTFAGTNIAAEC
jgi:D-glycero-alpha-D-manno-heptose-7-phosphate kinase